MICRQTGRQAGYQIRSRQLRNNWKGSVMMKYVGLNILGLYAGDIDELMIR